MDVSYSMEQLHKEFGGAVAVEDATMQIAKGSVHGVIGKNGAGKSVLMNMVAGVFKPTGGRLTVSGQEIDTHRWNPRVATDLGVALIPQEPPDLPHMNVEDFLFLGDRSNTRAGLLHRGAIRRKVAEIDDRLALRVLPSDPMTALPIEVQQLLAFAKAVFLERATVVLLDEITASLSGERRTSLLAQLNELAEGRSFTLISHRIAEIMSTCHRVTVMRDGRSVQTVEVAHTTPAALADAIVGKVDVHLHETPEQSPDHGPAVIRLRDLTSLPELEPTSFEVQQGEVLGLAGVEGSGKEELLEVLAGLRPSAGDVSIDGRIRRLSTPRAAARHGVAYLPKKREEYATIHGLSVLENLVLPVARRLSGGLGVLRESKVRQVGLPVLEQMQVKAPSPDADIDTLSGGNRQKVMLGRLMLMRPRVYVLSEPTRGVDIATKPELLRVVRQELTRTSAVIVTSESEEELVEVCDRILVFLNGTGVREVRRGEAAFNVGEIYGTGQGVWKQ
jgi:ABC-type sugar transport system ATPase subunit